MDRQRQHNQGAGTLIARSGSPADGTQGKRTLVDAIAGGFGVGALAHARPAASRVAERELNAALKVVAFDAHGGVIRTWGAKATWEGPLPQHFHGDHRGGTWHWNDAASARSVRVHTEANGTGGESVESWAARLHAARVEIFAEPLDAVTEPAARDDDGDPSAPGHADDVRNAPGHSDGESQHAGGSTDRVNPGDHEPEMATSPGSHRATPSSNTTGSPPPNPAEHGSPEAAGPDERLADVTAFERELGIELAQDEDAGDGDGDASTEPHGTEPHGKNGSGGAGYDGGDPAGRTGKDASTTGHGPGGDTAKAGGDDEGSTSAAPDAQGTKTGDRDGERHGSPNGRYAGEGRDGDNGVRGAGAIFGGVIAVPAALQGAVELALLIDAGDITGAGADLFKSGVKAGVGKAISVAAARRLVAREARIAAEHEMRAVVKQLATRKAFTSLAKAEQERVLRIVYWEKQRQFFRAYLAAARQEQRAIRQALKKARPAERAALEARRAAAHTGEEIAKCCVARPKAVKQMARCKSVGTS